MAETDFHSIIEPEMGGEVRADTSSWPGDYPNVWLRVISYHRGGQIADVVLEPREVMRLCWRLLKAAITVHRQRKEMRRG